MFVKFTRGEKQYAVALSSRGSRGNGAAAHIPSAFPNYSRSRLAALLQTAFPKQRLRILRSGRYHLVGRTVAIRIFRGAASRNEEALDLHSLQSAGGSLPGPTALSVFPRTKTSRIATT